jgi:phospholipid/cholesterol/gamma-HCH transport system substrate-binding protein
MKNQKKTEIKVGVTVLVAIVVLLWVLGWAKNFNFNTNEKELSISFNNIAGLLIGDVVSVQGIKEGYVKSISNQNNNVIVEVILSENTNLKEDAKFSIMMIDLMGGKKIEIKPGASENPIDYTKIQKGEFLGDISTTMAAIGSVQDDLVEVIYEIKETLTAFNKIINNSEFVDELESSVFALNKLISKTDKIISDNSSSVTELINNTNELVANSNSLIMENKDNIKTTVEGVNELLSNTDQMISKLDSFFDEIKNKDNNLGKIIYDETLVEDLSITLKNLKELSELINKQLNEKGLKVDAYIF